MSDDKLDFSLLERWRETLERKTDQEQSALKFGGGGGTFDSMDLVDAKIAASEARTDAKFSEMIGQLSTMRAELGGKLDTMNARSEHVEKSTAGIKTTVIVTAIAALGLTVAIMAFGSQWFGLGMDAQQISQRSAQTAIDSSKARIDDLDKKLDQLIQVTRPRPTAPQQ